MICIFLGAKSTLSDSSDYPLLSVIVKFLKKYLNVIIMLRGRELKSMGTISGPAGIQTKDLVKCLPLSHWTYRRGAVQKLNIAALCGGLSQFSTEL